jgi:hypothetical protein
MQGNNEERYFNRNLIIFLYKIFVLEYYTKKHEAQGTFMSMMDKGCAYKYQLENP